MTIAEAQNFYEQDEKKYQVNSNDDFVYWLKSKIIRGYSNFIEIDGLQELIDNIVNWYEIKYPERELEALDGIRNIRFKDIKKLSDEMDTEQLLFRLPGKQVSLLDCGYRARGWGQRSVYKDGKEIGCKFSIFMQIKKKNVENEWEAPDFLLIADHMTGEVTSCLELEDYINIEENMNLEEILSSLSQNCSDKLDFIELKECIYNHNCDIELRNKILQLVALKLLYSKNTIPERGYERAKRFINEFNEYFGISLSTSEIDEIINRNYKNDRVLSKKRQ